MTSIILLNGASPLLAIATTVDSSIVESSTAEPTTDTSNVENPETVTEEIPASEEPAAEPEYVEVEADYDENELSDEYKEDSAQPAVYLTEKNLTDEVTFKGEILAGIEQQENRRTETHLTKLVLQCSESDDSWGDVHTFEIKDDSTAIQVEKYAFDFSKSLDEVKAGNYRLIAEYDIQEYEEDSLKRVNRHKGMFMVGEVEDESEEEVSSSDTDASSQNLTQSEAKSSTNQLPFSGSLYASNGLGRSGNPALEVIYQGPREFNRVGITNVKNRSATAQVSYEADQHLTVDGTTYAVWSTSSTYMRDVIQPSQLLGNSYSLSETDWQRLVNNGNYTQGEIVSIGGGRRQDKFNLTGLLPNKYHYVWFIRIVTTTGPFGSITSRSGYFPTDTTQWLNNDKNIYNPFRFKTDMPDPLTITAPKFYHDSTTQAGTTIKMEGQAYTGDITPTNYQGRVYINNGVNTLNPVTALGHNLNPKTYHGGTITGLKPGTRYQGQVMIRNYLEGPIYSDWGGKDGKNTYFYTPNTVWEPSVASRNTPTTTTDASATLYARYNVGETPAHPTSVKVEYKEAASGTWSSTSAGSIEPANNRVKFSLSGLKAKTAYDVRVSVLNASGIWSYSSNAHRFTTNGIKLSLNPPNFSTIEINGGNGGTSVQLSSSSYTGDITTTPNTGILEMAYENAPSTSFQTKLTGIQYSGGVVNSSGRTVTGLERGTKYKARLKINDYGTNGTNGSPQFSGEKSVSTTNFVNTPVLSENKAPTATVRASARFTSTYVVNSNPALAAHPTSLEVIICRPNLGEQWDFDNPLPTQSGQGPYVEILTFGNGNIDFRVRNLDPKELYRVAHRVRNAGGISNWAEGSTVTTYANPITISSQPTITVNSATSAILNKGSYSGDASRTDLKVQKQTTTGAWVDSNIPSYENVPMNSTHYATTTQLGFPFGGLLPGSKYRSKIMMKYNDASNRWQDSSTDYGWYEYITPNVVATPSSFTFGDPPGIANEATVTLVASYEASDGISGSHPTDSSWDSVNNSWNNVQVEISRTGEDSGFWRITDNTSDGRLVPTEPPVVDPVAKTVTFKVSGLLIKQEYWIRCQVKNDSGIWSGYPNGKYIKTPGLKLTINAPKFKQETATDTSIDMEGQRYNGDITQFNGQGIVKVTPNNGGIWENKVTDLMHMQNQGTALNPQFYADVTVPNLEPGTQYRGQVAIKDSIEEYRDSPWGGKDGIDTHFYTKNGIKTLSEPTQETPTSSNGAVATFTAGYKAADINPAYIAAHPNKVKVFLSTDGISYDLITTTSSGPKLEADDDINTIDKEVTFKLEGLQENTHYYVKYAVVNEGGTSSKSAPYEFDTLGRTPGFYVHEAPSYFNFGVIDYSGSELSHSLVNASPTDETLIDFENINVNSQWILSAKLSQLLVSNGSETLSGSKILLDREIKKTADNGTTWNTVVSTYFDSIIGVSGQLTLPSDGSTSVPIVKATDIAYGKGNFRSVIPLDSVELVVPANTGMEGKVYEGKITWTLDATP